jgi:hypothetical protein
MGLVNDAHEMEHYDGSVRIVVSTVSKCVEQTWTQRSRRPSPFSLPSVPSVFQEASGSGDAHESTRAGTCPRRTSDSPTTLTCLLIYRRAWPASLGCPSTGFSPTTCSRRGRSAKELHVPSSTTVGGGGALALRGCQCHSR